MGARAVISIDELNGTQASAPRRFWSGTASPDVQIPHLADFYTWTLDAQQPLTVASYLRYATDHPGALPDDEDTGRQYTDDQPRGDLDYRYQLTLSEDQHGLRLRVQTPSPPQHTDTGGATKTLTQETLTQASLYDAAARCCDTVAARDARYTQSTASVPMPGGDPQVWRRRAAGYRQRHRSAGIATVAANLYARFHPATFDVPHPALQVAGAWVFAYLDSHAVLRISVHLDETAPWLLTAQRTVPMRITVEDTDVFTGY